MHPVRFCLALASCVFGVACASSEGSSGEAADEGELSLFGGDKRTEIVVGKVVLSSPDLASRVTTAASARKVLASPRDGELSGGLVMLSGADFEKLHFGLQCTARDGTCVLRWMSRSESLTLPLRIGGELAKAMRPAFDGFDGGATNVSCRPGQCLVYLDEEAARTATFERITVEESAAQKFGGFD